MTSSRYGRLIGASLGPGHPEDITRRAWAALTGSARWTYPVKKAGESSYALEIALSAGLALPDDAVELVFPMTTHADLLARAWAVAAQQTLALLAEGRDVVFLVEGDASTYATFGHLARAVQALAPAVEVIVLPGVSSYCAAAARVGQPLADADDTLAILPANYGVEYIAHLLDEFDTLVLLKVRPQLDAVIDLLAGRGILAHARFIEKVGSPDERVVTDLHQIKGETVAYLSLLIIHNPERQRRPLVKGCRRKAVSEAAASMAAAGQ